MAEQALEHESEPPVDEDNCDACGSRLGRRLGTTSPAVRNMGTGNNAAAGQT
jgi:hypothetical protein